MPSRSSGLAAETEKVRTLALVGPPAGGKTTLAEAMLVAGGALRAAGSLEKGSTLIDHPPIPPPIPSLPPSSSSPFQSRC